MLSSNDAEREKTRLRGPRSEGEEPNAAPPNDGRGRGFAPALGREKLEGFN